MSARNCPACRRELLGETLRALEQGVDCPYCFTRIKRTPRRTAPALPVADYAALEVSDAPPVIAQPAGEDSFKWFQSKGSPGAAAPVATASPAPARSPLKSLPKVAAPGLTPSTAATEIAKRPASLDPPSPAAPVQPRRAPTVIGGAAPPAEKASPPSPVEKPPAPPPVEKPSAPPPAPVEKPSPPASVQPSIARPVAEPPREALALTAVVPSAGATLALSAPAMGFPLRTRRNVAIAVGAAMSVVAVGILVLRGAPADPPAPIASAPLAAGKPPSGSAPVATSHETSRAPVIQPLHRDKASARAEAEPETGGEAAAAAAREAPTTATPARGKVGTAHGATAHQRRQTNREEHATRARHEKRNTRRVQVASRATPSPSDDGEARATYQRGNALLFAGDAAGAVAAYRKAVELAPADPIGYRGLGLAYEQQGETTAAIRALKKYLKLAPGAADREIISRRIVRLGHAPTRL
jgi:hypothetical protein